MVDSTYRHCFETASAAAGRQLTDDELDRIFTRAQGRMDRYVREGLSPREAAVRAGTELAAEERAANAIERRNAALNLQKRVERRRNVLAMADAIGGKKGPDFAEAMEGQISGGRNAPGPGNRVSAEAVWRTREREYLGALVLGLEKAGLLATFRKGTLADAWGRELYELSMRAAGEPDRVGLTGSPEAQKIAGVVHGLQQLAKERLNREGTWIGDYAGYITRTAHDRDKMRRAGFDAWRAFIEPRLGARTFEDVPNAARGQFLRDTYDALVTGVHLSDRQFAGTKDPAFTGPGNLAKRLSESRKLHFADASSWLQYQQQFGHGSLAEQVMGAFNRAARQEALLRRWGTNPEAELVNDMRWLQENERGASPDAVRDLLRGWRGVKLRMDYLTGDANTPTNQTRASVFASIRAIQSMGKLGAVALTHLSAFPTKASELRYHGVGWLQSYANSFAAPFQGRGSGQTRELSDLLLAGIEGMHGHLASRFHADDALPGTMSKLANSFFRASILTHLVDSEKAGTARLMSRALGREVDNGFADLPPQLQRLLTSYAISPEDWDVLRTAPAHTMVDDRIHLTPDAAQRNLSTDLARADTLSLKLRTLFADVADRGIVTPGIEEKALFLHDTPPGSWLGELARCIAQFKMWGAAAVRQILGREINGGQGVWGATNGMFQLTLGMTVFGYLTIALKSLFKGKMPPDPLDAHTIGAALMQGGGYGLLGDFLLAHFDRFGQTAAEAIAGPTAGVLSDAFKLWSTARGYATGDPNARPKDLGPEAFRIVAGNTPFLNLFYLRRALDYLLFHSLQESMNPGYLRRAERSMQQRTGQTFVLSPQNHLRTFGR